MIKIKPSSKNTNKHTEDGMQLLKTSIDKVGVLESISVTKEGTIISGHARNSIFLEKGMIAKEIHLQENEYPVIVTDIEDNTKQYYEAQILANTTANKNFNLDTELIEEIAVEYGIDIAEMGIETIKDLNDETYTSKVESPIYTPKEEKPKEDELYNLGKYNELMDKINSSNLADGKKLFLQLAATRHIQFNYAKIAEFYSHEEKEIQDLMEDSALVIIDYAKAIELGFVKLYEDLEKISEIDG